jgi:outer membrane protein
MKKVMKLMMLLAFICTAMGVSAQVKLGHIDAQKLISTMPETIAAQKQLEQKQVEIEKELTNMKTQFQEKVAEYEKNAQTYSEVVLANKQQELQEMQQRIIRFQEIASNNLQKTQQDLMNPIITKAMEAIKAVGKANGFTYIYDVNALLYVADNSEDILPLVKKKLGMQ